MQIRIAAAPAALLVAVVLAACGGSSSTPSTASSSSAATVATSATTASRPDAASTTTATASSSPTGVSYEGIPLEVGPFIAPADTTETGTVDGIRCGRLEQLAYHIHAHLAVFVNSRLYALPGGIGIPGSVTQQTNEGPVATGGQCFYWLHTHTSDGVIHIESPIRRIYTLGQFFDEWHQPLSANRVGDIRGKITALFNGKPWMQEVRAIPLLPHAEIQFNIGEPAPPLMKVSWAHTGL